MGKTQGIDGELAELLLKLEKIQNKVGGGKPVRAEVEARGGAGKDAFLDLKEAMMDKLRLVRKWMAEALKNPAEPARDQISRESNIKKAQRELQEDWNRLDELLRKDAKSRRSKLTKEDVELRTQIVALLRTEMDNVRDAQRGGKPGAERTLPGNLGGYAAYLEPMATSELFVTIDHPREEQELVSEDQQQRMMLLRERDQDFDKTIGQIGEGVDVLLDIAKMQKESVGKQNVMIEDLGTRIDNVHDHLTNINAKMKSSLDDVSSGSDKICVNLMCLLFLIGLCVILYQLMVVSKAK
ncbi:hypothetical protein M885DRAFT_543818 [Pelagophyceae sp. CCMP2097]|nr:hypothetical protein M885DRAFT_543818 [Pelagophyceae sp. CCMP2097]|mmetsp:Transcript_20496/g.69468  ORF Transcript_20496/g.69468 Transcript_20496/m.69468 type:complete len:297 (+) Transcript_20496:103-993(+)